MSVSVSMPQLGESVTEGTVTRWLKKEGERVEADEPLLEVSTDKVDTEIPSPVGGILRGIVVAEDETVAVGAELAVIDETGAEGAPADGGAPAPAGQADQAPAAQAGDGQPAPAPAEAPAQDGYPYPGGGETDGGYQQPAAYQPGQYEAPAGYQPQAPAAAPDQGSQPAPPDSAPAGDAWQRAQPAPPPAPPAAPPAQQEQQQPAPPPPAPAQAEPQPPAPAAPASPQSPVAQALSGQPPAQAPAPPPPPPPPAPAAEAAVGSGPGRAASALGTSDGPYVTPLVRKLAAEHGVDLATVAGTGVGGRIRKQDVIDAARVRREAVAAAQAAAAPDTQPAPAPAAGQAPAGPQPGAPARAAIEPSSLRGTTERMSRARQVIARRMVESLQTSAQLTTVVEVDITEIARLRDRAKADFESREGVKLSFLPFFALAAVEALKVHPRLNASIDPDGTQVTYHDAEHLGIAVDTERGLMVPVIRNAGDLNVGGLARKIADLAARTRAGQVSPDDLAGGTFTLTNTGSRGALFDTPIINQPQVGILGTGAVVRRPVVVPDPALGEVIAVRSMVYLALSYDHRLVDGADAARFLVTVKQRLEEGAFEAELGL